MARGSCPILNMAQPGKIYRHGHSSRAASLLGETKTRTSPLRGRATGSNSKERRRQALETKPSLIFHTLRQRAGSETSLIVRASGHITIRPTVGALTEFPLDAVSLEDWRTLLLDIFERDSAP